MKSRSWPIARLSVSEAPMRIGDSVKTWAIVVLTSNVSGGLVPSGRPTPGTSTYFAVTIASISR